MAGAMVGGAFLSAFLQVAFDRLASRDFLDFFKKQKLNQTLLSNLKIVLLSIDAVVDDAEQKQITNPKVKDWIDLVKDAVFDAEDILDAIDYEMCKGKLEAEQKSQTGAIGKVRSFFSASVSSFEKKIESRMKTVLENLEYLASQRDILRLNERDSGAGLRSAISNRLPTASLVDENATYGRDDDKETIIEWLLSEKYNNQPSMISIVGMGGLGKTTLAQLVFNDSRVMDGFNLKVWVCVSDEFDVLRVTRTIYEAITGYMYDTNDLNTLQIKLKQQLTQKRFLLVLDDVWNENYMLWEALQSPFNNGALGSKILLTTRSKKVASTMRSADILQLKPLSKGDSWSLFSRYAFHGGNVLCANTDLEEIGRKISKKCKGLPLALKAIGSLLYTESSHENWNGILKCEIWEEKSDSEILPALRLSYCYLPSHLKRCFAYCSIFPKDYAFDKEQLIQLWMAENFLTCAHQSKDGRELGEQFFNDLLLRSLFQRSPVDDTRFIMHDLTNDMAKVEYGKFCHRLELDDVNKLTEMTRHISFLRNYVNTSKRFEVIYKANKLRTFLPLPMQGHRSTSYNSILHFISGKFTHNLPSKFTCMRVLSLSDHFITQLPDSIGNLKHLGYLDLSGTKIRKLPDSICQLHHLQTLKLWRCCLLEKLPMDFHKLMNLRHLDFRETQVREMPEKFDKLKNLQVLSSFIIDKFGETNIKYLEGLNLHGSFSISGLQNVASPSAALGVNLRSKIHLKELTLEWCTENKKSPHDKDVLDNFQPHKNLKKLSIGNYGGIEFPNWLANHSLSNLMSLELRHCKYCISLPSIGLFPSLKSLSIIGFDNIVVIGPEFCGSSSNASSLEILRFGDMKSWEEWKCEILPLTFPHLQELSIENCPKLKGQLPQQLPSLRMLVISNCEKLLSSIPRDPSLDKLVLRNCGNEQLESLPSSLKVLDISGGFKNLLSVDKIKSVIANCKLEELKFSDCPHLDLPPCYFHNFILEMEIRGSCDSLKSFPLDLFPKLQSLKLIDCNNLEMISISEGNHFSLVDLYIRKCPRFVRFPKGGFLAPKLMLCCIEELKNLKSLPEKMCIFFPSLLYLVIRCCPQVESFLEEGLPSKLQYLDVLECPKLIASRRGWHLNSLTSLYHLGIGDADDESLPDIGLLPPTITSLSFHNCPNLRSLEHKGLCHLSSLEGLGFRGCPKLQHFPKEDLLNSLCMLRVIGCPLLKKKIQKQNGKYRAIISHIPFSSTEDDVVGLIGELLTHEGVSFATIHSAYAR
ncbi:putative disease resistance RPP13-like protein 1 [Neltuma alba]|uniref:putative disease resistance RPP13-like protein 1 n=1 Tax=Neltuma alba TaxID=207710 RepID=UPI0010A4E133|nr:putative disease resistance RPP13-like protein 1 [Prosopis alba]